MTDNKYQNGKIYTIRNKNNDTLIYVGSTVQPLHKRFHAHKFNAYNEKCKGYNMLLYQKMRETNNINDWYIELYEDFPTERREQLNKREGEIIREISTLNKRIAGRTQKDFFNENNEYLKNYYQENKQKIKEQIKNNNQIKTYKVRILRELNNGLIDIKTVRCSTIEKYKIKLDDETKKYISEF